jgi:hypothetical protein
MNTKSVIPATGIIVLILAIACTKKSSPIHPVTDTITITKTDTLVLPPPSDTPNLTNGLVLYLPFNGSFADSSGSGYTVTALDGATLGNDMHGYAQSAFSSSGNGARLVISNNGAYSVDTAFAVSFDFMIRAAPNNSALQIFLSIVDTANGNGPTFNCGLNIPGAAQIFNFGANTATIGCEASGDNNPLNKYDTSGFAPQVGSWYNVILMYANGTQWIYVNGQLISAKSGFPPAVQVCPNANFVVGGWWNGDPMSINGELDELRFYNRRLNAQQISWLSRNFQPNSVSTMAMPGLKNTKPSRF